MQALLCGYCKWKGMGGVSQEADRPLKKKKKTTQWSERDWGSWRDKPAGPQIADLFQVPKLGSPRLHVENNCLFVLECNLRKLLESREIRAGSGPGKFSVGGKKSKNNRYSKKHHQIRWDFPSLPWCLFSECFISYCCGRRLGYWCFST